MQRIKHIIPILIILALFIPFSATSTLASTSYSFFSHAYDATITSVDNSTYADAQDPDDWDYVTCDYTSTTLRVGQYYDNPTYSVNRGVLFFDTTSLPDDITIETVTLSLWAQTIENDDTDTLYVVNAGDHNQPPEYDEFKNLGSTTLSTAKTFASFSTSAYVDVTLTDAGEFLVKPDAVTVLGLRAYDDIHEDAPTGDTYIDFYSGDSIRKPYLTVTYTINDLGNPNSINISDVAVFTNYLEDGDQLFCFAETVDYGYIPDLYPTEYYEVNLIAGITEVGTTPVYRWGYNPLSIYLDSDDAIEWEGDATLILTGLDAKFDTPPEFEYEIQEDDWKDSAEDSDIFRSWIYTITDNMEDFDDVNYYDTVDGSMIGSTGSQIFAKGIPYINIIYPDLFILGGEPLPEEETETTDEYSDSLYDSWGTYWVGIWEGIGDGIGGLSGYVVVSFIFIVLAIISAIILSRSTTGTLAYVAPFSIMMAGFLFGVPWWGFAIGSMVVILYFYYNTTVRGI